jgi:hypothetical protein
MEFRRNRWCAGRMCFWRCGVKPESPSRATIRFTVTTRCHKTSCRVRTDLRAVRAHRPSDNGDRQQPRSSRSRIVGRLRHRQPMDGSGGILAHRILCGVGRSDGRRLRAAGCSCRGGGHPRRRLRWLLDPDHRRRGVHRWTGAGSLENNLGQRRAGISERAIRFACRLQPFDASVHPRLTQTWSPRDNRSVVAHAGVVCPLAAAWAATRWLGSALRRPGSGGIVAPPSPHEEESSA